MKPCKSLFIPIITVLLLPLVAIAESVWDNSKESLPIAMASPEITVYRSLTCKCCKGWIDHLEKHDFTVIDVTNEDVRFVKQRLGVPEGTQSCHTAEVGGYTIEGHVPADDIKRLLKQRPKDIAGLSVPRMPVGTPGMETEGRKDPFNVISFDKEGNVGTFNEYWAY